MEILNIGDEVMILPGTDKYDEEFSIGELVHGSVPAINQKGIIAKIGINCCLVKYIVNNKSMQLSFRKNRLSKINKNIQTKMKKINNFMKRLLDADTKKLINAGIINGDLLLTSEGREALESIVFQVNKAELLKIADEIIADEVIADKNNK